MKSQAPSWPGFPGIDGPQKGWEDREVLGEAKQEWLETFLDLPNGIPSADNSRFLRNREFEGDGVVWVGAGSSRSRRRNRNRSRARGPAERAHEGCSHCGRHNSGCGRWLGAQGVPTFSATVPLHRQTKTAPIAPRPLATGRPKSSDLSTDGPAEALTGASATASELPHAARKLPHALRASSHSQK
jgi:hypothetical protein